MHINGVKSRYEEKRDFERTPEPPGASDSVDSEYSGRFVIHRHEATRLHYDLRIFNGTALSSWAVPKGFSYHPKDKHLAVQTEDHPIMYLDFEGVIPRGEYGGGTIRVWDQGSFELVRGEYVDAEIETGELKLIFRGQRVRGEWHIVNTRNDEWLLFKAKDLYAREHEHLVPPSVDLAMLSPMLTPMHTLPGRMKPARVVEPFDDVDWIFELDFPGIPVRIEAGKKQSVTSVRGRNLSRQLPEIIPILESFRTEHAIAEGVLVTQGQNLPSEESARATLDGLGGVNESLVLYLYDLLAWDEFDTCGMSAVARKEILRSIVPPSDRVLFVDYVSTRGERLAAEAAKLGMFELIAKRADSSYEAGKSSNWRSVDCRTMGMEVATRRIKFTNRSKVFWPGTDFTKGELLDYYEMVADMMLPQIAGRPIHMLRYPNGIEGKHFYQRHVPEHAPDWIDTVELGPEDHRERFVVCSNRESILYLINLGSIDLHPWMSRAEQPDHPTYCVIDIDAKQSDFTVSIKAAKAIGKVLSGIEIESFIKTSGGTGLHVVIPIEPRYSYDQSRMFAETISRIVAMQHPDSFTVERNPNQRGRRVYLDYLQNARGQTVVAPYVVRPRIGAPVSMPIQWDEVSSSIAPSDFTLRTAPARIEVMGDIFRGVVEKRQSLEAPIENLERYIESL